MFTGSIVALVTPFKKEDQSIDFLAVKKLIDLHLSEGTDGLVVGGTTGEGPTLELDEFCELLEFVLKQVNGKIPVFAGTGFNSTKKTVEMTRLAKKIGATGALVIVPYYNKPTDAGVLAHFKEVNQLEFPFIVYHHPGRCGIELDVETLVELSTYTYCVGIKECSKNKDAFCELLEKNPKAVIFSGDDDRSLEMIQMGAKGSISVIANLYPGYWNQVIHLALSGNIQEAKERYAKMKLLLWAISLETNPQGIKCALSKEGLCENILRLPLLPVSSDTEEEICSFLSHERLSADLPKNISEKSSSSTYC